MVGSEIDQLIISIAKLPGLGRRSAQRIALHLLKYKEKSFMENDPYYSTNAKLKQ